MAHGKARHLPAPNATDCLGMLVLFIFGLPVLAEVGLLVGMLLSHSNNLSVCY